MSSAHARKHRGLLCNRWSNTTFDRVAVLGEDGSGHSGCVNALSWARDGELLLSGSDDRTIQIWAMDSSLEADYPFAVRSVIYTQHTANIFNVHLLPHSNSIASVAGDGEVQVHDMGGVHSCTHRLRCHADRTKRVVTEDSPHLFLTVSEDGSVRQHDLRNKHNCQSGSCPPPLLKMHLELSTISMSTLTPYQFVVAGESEFGYLFDRRQAGRFLREEWGMVENGMTHCVRRFGRPTRSNASAQDFMGREHITGSRMSAENGHEVLLSYSADAVYSYSTLDEPQKEEDMAKPSTPLSDGEEEGTPTPPDSYGGVPLIMPRTRYSGARNIQTIKDVNFLGPRDEFVVSGSDCGNLFIWEKDSGQLHALLEGDSTVVNVIEGHPHLPLFACSGIDETIKLFAPVSSEPKFSRIDQAEEIIAANERPRLGFQRLSRHHFTALLASIQVDDESSQCNHQ